MAWLRSLSNEPNMIQFQKLDSTYQQEQYNISKVSPSFWVNSGVGVGVAHASGVHVAFLTFLSNLHHIFVIYIRMIKNLNIWLFSVILQFLGRAGARSALAVRQLRVTTVQGRCHGGRYLCGEKQPPADHQGHGAPHPVHVCHWTTPVAQGTLQIFCYKCLSFILLCSCICFFGWHICFRQQVITQYEL